MSNQQITQTQQSPMRRIDPGEGSPGRLAEVVVHINDNLDEAQRDALEEAMRAQHGVLDLRYCRNRHHLMIVQYQPELVSSAALIEQVRRLAGEAQLIGPI